MEGDQVPSSIKRGQCVMNKGEMVKWELIEQIVWLVALAATAVILLAQSVLAPVEIPVTGPGALGPASSEVVQVLQPEEISGFNPEQEQSGVVR